MEYFSSRMTDTDFIVIVTSISLLIFIFAMSFVKLRNHKKKIVTISCFGVSNIIYWLPAFNSPYPSEYLMWATIALVPVNLASISINLIIIFVFEKICIYINRYQNKKRK